MTAYQQIIEDGMVVSQRLLGANAPDSICLLEIACNVAKFGGVSNLLDNPDYKGTIAANPAEQSYFHVQTWSSDATTSIITVEVVIEYWATFTEPRALTQSLKSALHRGLLAEERKTCLR